MANVSLLCNEAAADSEPPLRDSLAANVRIFLAKDSVVLLLEVCFDLVVPLWDCQRPDVDLRFIALVIIDALFHLCRILSFVLVTQASRSKLNCSIRAVVAIRVTIFVILHLTLLETLELGLLSRWVARLRLAREGKAWLFLLDSFRQVWFCWSNCWEAVVLDWLLFFLRSRLNLRFPQLTNRVLLSWLGRAGVALVVATASNLLLVIS